MLARHRTIETAASADENSAADPFFVILFVCTANICRSPMAEAVARHLLDETGTDVSAIRVTSAGVSAPRALHTAPEVVRVLGERGVSFPPRAARPVKQSLLDRADLVLCAERAHRGEVVTLSPGAMRRTFTLGEFDRLASAVAPQVVDDGGCRAAALVRAVFESRGAVRAPNLDDDDIADPYGGPLSGYRMCAERIAAALERVVPLLAT